MPKHQPKTSGNDHQLAATLAAQVMGWTVTPDRYFKDGRSWIPRWRFAPLSNIEDAFAVLDQARAWYRLEATGNDEVAAEVRIGDRTGVASDVNRARAISLAVARSLGLEP